MYKEVEINDLSKLATFIIENEHNKIAIESPEFNNNKDLFFFCIELTIEIIKILYNTTDINDLSLDNIERVKNILITACIQFNLNIIELDNLVDFEKQFIIPNNNIELQNYYFNINNKNKQYKINFKIISY
jgi:hypothetical protein